MAPNDSYEDPRHLRQPDAPSPASDRETDSADSDADRADPDPLAYLVREPQQARSRKTLSRIMAAADALLLERGPDALTVAAIARRARASVGSFYARFDGKEELVRYLGEKALQAASEEWSDRFNEALGEALAEVAQGSEGTDDGGAQALFGPLRDLARFLLESFLSGPPSRLERLDRIEDPDPARLARFQGRVLQDLEELFARVAGCGEVQGEVGARIFLSAVRALAAAERAPGSPASVVADPSTAATEVARAVGLYLAAAAPSRIPGAASPRAAPPTSPASSWAAEGVPAGRATDDQPVHEPTPEPRPDRPELEEPLPWAEADEPPAEPSQGVPQETTGEGTGAEPEDPPTWGELAWEYPEAGEAERSRPEPGERGPGQPEPAQPDLRADAEVQGRGEARDGARDPRAAEVESESEDRRTTGDWTATEDRAATEDRTATEDRAATEDPAATEVPAATEDPATDDPDDDDPDDEDPGDVELFDVWG